MEPIEWRLPGASLCAWGSLARSYTRPGGGQGTMLHSRKETQMDHRIALFISCAAWMRRCAVLVR